MKIKLDFTSDPDELEYVNFLLSAAIQSAEANPEWMKGAMITKKDLEKCGQFRMKIVKALTS